MIKKLGIFIVLILMAPFIGGLYGIIHDQITYTISPEYYTKLKFYQFGLVGLNEEWNPESPRLYVALVGFLATWWMGIIIGLILGLLGLLLQDWKIMFQVVLRAIIIAVIITILAGFVGLIYGSAFFQHANWKLPINIIDEKSFIIVGSMHNFSYLGGLIGLIIGIKYILAEYKNKARA